jgi:DNA modification methylase
MQGDCLERMKEIPDGSVDMVLTDPPYFRVKNEKWDKMWKDKKSYLLWIENLLAECRRVYKPSGAIAIFCDTYISHNIACLGEDLGMRVDSINQWVKPDAAGAEKSISSGRINRPAKVTESYIVFREENPLGFALRDAMEISENTALSLNRNVFNKNTGLVSLWLCNRDAWGACLPSEKQWILAMRYCGVNVSSEDYKRLYQTFNSGFLDYNSVNLDYCKGLIKKHPCQKPLPLIELLTQAYTNKGETVLDFTMGSGTTGVAAKNLNRKFIGIELDETYFNIAKDRIIGGKL